MLFSSTVFLYIFLPLTLLFYYVFLRRFKTAKNVFLFMVSIFFYAWGEPRFALVMLASIFVNWLLGLLVHHKILKGQRKGAKLAVFLSSLFNLGLLFVFKYLSFTSSVLAAAGLGVKVYTIVLPIGISFFTFQAMSYVVDVYRGRGSVQTNILNVGLYIAFFPQLIAGPIVRYETVAEEINHRKETLADLSDGFARFIVGLGKKVLLANSFGLMADQAFGLGALAGGLSVGMAWLGAFAYTFQIFFDFSGYSDMAIGLGKMFGFHFLENFDYPYISTSITEFWRRWHISLGTWFRDYVYIPLGGSRVKTKWRLALNLFVVWALTGIWHGAEWTFLIWGLMYFVLLCAEKLICIPKLRIPKAICRVYTLFFVVMGWVLFRADNLACAVDYFKAMFAFNTIGYDGVFAGYFMQNLVLLIVGIIGSVPLLSKLSEKMNSKKLYPVFKTVGLLLVLVLSLASLVSSSYNPFIYFNF